MYVNNLRCIVQGCSFLGETQMAIDPGISWGFQERALMACWTSTGGRRPATPTPRTPSFALVGLLEVVVRFTKGILDEHAPV